MISSSQSFNGEYKIEVYEGNGKLKSTTNYSSNYITNTGVRFISEYAYADCFRYVSLGSGTSANSGQVTGLNIPIRNETCSYVGGNTYGCEPSRDVPNQYYDGCGYTIGDDSVTLRRSWRIPAATPETESSVFFKEPYVFQELMFSPGRSGTPGYSGNSAELTTTCSCGAEQELFLEPNTETQSTYVYGKESPDIYAYYPNICKNGQLAFSRILKEISVGVGDYIAIWYNLKISFRDPYEGSKFYSTVTQGSLHEDYLTAKNWTSGFGISSLIHYGIKLVSNQADTPLEVDVDSATQSFDTIRYGESFVPPFGMAMEPSCPIIRKMAYLSNDNLMFLVNNMSGGACHSVATALTGGTIGFHKNYISDCSSSEVSLGDADFSDPKFCWVNSPRSETWADKEVYPLCTDYYKAGKYNDPNVKDLAGTTEDKKFAIISMDNAPGASQSYSPIGTAQWENRSGLMAVSFQFLTRGDTKIADYSVRERPVRALVYGYLNSDNAKFANLDALFATQGWANQNDINAYKPTTSSIKDASHTYYPPTGIYKVGDTGYSYLDGEGSKLTVTINLTWGASTP